MRDQPADIKLRRLLNVRSARELLTTEQVRERFPNFPSREAVRKFVARWKVPTTKIGRAVLIDPRDIEAVSERKRGAA